MLKKSGLTSIYIGFLILIASCASNENFEGYKLIEKRFVKEVNADCYYLEHIKSGAKIFKIAADDPNKTFAVSFKTLPENDCGTPHILEHSVLNGSKNFPVKSPFDVLNKGSLKTFLNAFTSKDRTMYPAASLNEKDYFNLMHVYYDAVFNPLIYDDPDILKQEGWHHELASADDDVVYKGVVYNEMKGAFSGPDRELFYQACKQLFPNNTYGYSSGGYPEAIPELTYESFINFHEKYYHPSNSYIFFYGDADLAKELAFIDTAYLANYNKADMDFSIPMHQPLEKMKEITEYYPVAEGESTENKTLLSLSLVIGDGTDESLGMSLDVLADVLFNRESAPVRLALQKAGIGSDISAWSYGLRQYFFQITAKNANPEDSDKFKEIVFATLDSIATAGIDKEALEGKINRMEFSLREGDDANKGISLMSANIANWMYKGDPFSGIEYEKPLAVVKQALSNSNLEQIVKDDFINNNYKVQITLVPKPGLEKEKSQKIKVELNEYKSSLNDEEIAALIQDTEALIAKQEEEDSPEALATIPMLSLNDIDPNTKWFSAQAKELNGNTLIHFDEFTNSILYTRYIFDLKVIEQNDIPYLGIFRELLGKLNTENYTYSELDNVIKINTGGLSYGLSSQLNRKDNFALLPQFRVSAKATMDKADKMLELIEEVLLKTNFNDTSRIKTILNKQLARIEANINRNGFGYTRKRLASYHSEQGLFNELHSGIEYYWFLKNIVDNFDKQADAIIAKMETISNRLFVKNNIDVGIICADNDYNKVKDRLSESLALFANNELELQAWNLTPKAKNEGFTTSSKVQYVLQGANYRKLGYEYSGTVEVLNKLITSDWLHKEVRVKGGAYGGFGYFLKSGEVFLGSYRDPNLSETFDAFDGSVEFVRSYEADTVDLVRGVIGTMARLDYPMTSVTKGDIAINKYYTGYSENEAQKIRDEVLSVTIEDIRGLAPLVEKVLSANTFCVYGNQEVIQKNSELFNEVKSIIE